MQLIWILLVLILICNNYCYPNIVGHPDTITLNLVVNLQFHNQTSTIRITSTISILVRMFFSFQVSFLMPYKHDLYSIDKISVYVVFPLPPPSLVIDIKYSPLLVSFAVQLELPSFFNIRSLKSGSFSRGTTVSFGFEVMRMFSSCPARAPNRYSASSLPRIAFLSVAQVLLRSNWMCNGSALPPLCANAVVAVAKDENSRNITQQVIARQFLFTLSPVQAAGA